MRKTLFFLLCCCLFTLFCACKLVSYITIDLTDGDASFRKDYPFPLSTRLTALFSYGDDWEKYCEKDFSGDKNKFFGFLNEEIAVDAAVFSSSFEITPIDAEVTYVGDGVFSYTEGRDGRAATVHWGAARRTERGCSCSGSISFSTVPHSVTAEEQKRRTQKICSFTTEYASSSENRKHNVALAVRNLDNAVIPSGEDFSFNKTVGVRSEKNGFRKAPVLRNGVFSEGVGGGVCQISTSLYNCWCLAGLSVKKSRSHSRPVRYVPLGLDATVTDSDDMILTNSSSFPVYVDGTCDGNTATFTLYGEPCGMNIQLWSEKLRDIPCEEYETVFGDTETVIQEPQSGAIYRSYRDYYLNNRLIKREVLRISEYKPVKGIVMNRIPHE